MNNAKKFLLRLWPYLLIVMVTIFILWTQIKTRSYFMLGGDGIFHLNRTYDAAMQLKSGHFSWFLSLFGFHQTGRIVNAVYGPVFAYFLGGLLIITGSWFHFQVTMSFLATCLSGIFMYKLARYCRIYQVISVLLGLIYMTSGAITDYVYNQAFSGIGDVFLPLIVMAGVRMWRNHHIYILQLTILMTIIFQIHILSTLLSVLALIPFAIFSFLGNHHKLKWIIRLIISGCFTLLLTGDVWGSLWEVYGSNHIVPPFPNRVMNDPSFAATLIHGNLTVVNDNAIIAILIITLVLAIFNYRRFNLFNGTFLFLGYFFFWLLSSYFPWKYAAIKHPIIRQIIQMPRRFLGLFMVFILLALGIEIKLFSQAYLGHLKVSSIALILIMLIITGNSVRTDKLENVNSSTLWHSHVIMDTGEHPKNIKSNAIRNVAYTNNFGKATQVFLKPVPDYLPSSTHVYYHNFYKIHPYGKEWRELDQRYDRLNRIRKPGKPRYWYSAEKNKSWPRPHRSVIGKDTLVYTWNQPWINNRKEIRLPAVKYGHTTVRLNGKRLRNVKIDKVGAILIHSRTGLNKLSLQYQPSRNFKVIILITILSWLIMIVYLVKLIISKF